MTIDIYGDNISYVTNEVSSVETCNANLNEENRAKFVTDLAAVSRGKSESNNPTRRYQKLLREAAPTAGTIDAYETHGVEITGSPSRPLEFLPVVLTVFDTYCAEDESGFYLKIILCDTKEQIIHELNFLDFQNNIMRFSYMDKNYLYTNMRCLINAGVPYESIPYNTPEELKDFVALKAQIPMFVWAQVPNTHTAISKEAQSDRVTENERYWLPEDFRDRLFELTKDGTPEGEPIDHMQTVSGAGMPGIMNGNRIGVIQQSLLLYGDEIIDGLLSMSQNDVKDLFRILGYHKEIYNRVMYYCKYKEVVMTGWNNDPKVWKHLFLERSVKPELWDNWTQDITMKFVKAIKTIIEKEKI